MPSSEEIVQAFLCQLIAFAGDGGQYRRIVEPNGSSETCDHVRGFEFTKHVVDALAPDPQHFREQLLRYGDLIGLAAVSAGQQPPCASLLE